MKDIIEAGDILIMEGKSYISLDMYKNLQKQLQQVQDVAESFLQRLTSIEVANENRKQMKIYKFQVYDNKY